MMKSSGSGFDGRILKFRLSDARFFNGARPAPTFCRPSSPTLMQLSRKNKTSRRAAERKIDWHMQGLIG